MIRYTVDKYTGREFREASIKDLDQHSIAKRLQANQIAVIAATFYPTNNFVVISVHQDTEIIFKARSLGITQLGGSSVAIYQPQIWFLHFLYGNLPGAKKAIEFYIKRSYDIRERFTWGNINEELKTFVMAATLAEGT